MGLPNFTHPEFETDRLKEKGVSLVAFCDTVRKRKDGTCTIRLRVVFERVPLYYTTKIKMGESDYQKMIANDVRGDLRTKKIIILKLLKKAYDVILNMEDFSFQEFEEEFLNKKTEDKTNVYSWYEQKISELKRGGYLGNLQTYEYSLKSIKDFSDESDILKFNKITPEFLKKYENWMLSKGRTKTTVAFYLRPLRHLFNREIYNDKNRVVTAKSYPFVRKDEKGKYKIPAPRNIKKALAKADLKKLFNYHPKEGSSEQFYLDIWLFSYLSNGINMKDLFRLKYSCVLGDSIEFERAKSANSSSEPKKISIVFSERLKEIVSRWGNKPVSDINYIFPVLTEGLSIEQEQAKIKQATKQCNKYVKNVAAKLKIEAKVSTYTARHSFATILKNSGVPVSFIGEQLGHSSNRVTEKYLGSFEIKEKEKHTNNLTDFD